MSTTDDDISTLSRSGMPAWLDVMEKASEEEGYLEPLGARHWAFFHDDGPKLLVTFEAAADIRARSDQMPLGHSIAAARGWSALCIIADGATWYRDRRVYGYFDRLVDDAFLEDFDQVVFYGAGGMAGYAAAAYSVTAPGAAVVVITPRATMDPDLASWETRDLAARRLNFTDRYGYAPDMTEGAGQVFVLADPHFAPDAMHAALFARRNYVTRLAMRHTGPQTAEMARATELVAPLLDAAMSGTLSGKAFSTLWRGARRAHGSYVQSLRDRSAASGLASRAALLDRYAVLRRKGAGEALLSTAPANSDTRPNR
jgi:hypothetical protein